MGKGQFGHVYRGYDSDMDEVVAIKVLGRDVQVDDVLLEVKLQHRLREHAHVVNIRNVSIAAPRPFIVTEFYPAGSVADRILAGVSLVDSVRWVGDTLDALTHVHGLGVVHRDVKPGNMLLNNSGAAVLTDFGIAEETIRRRLNLGPYVPITAPEQLQGLASSPQTDVWAVGCCLYCLLTGRYPFGQDPTAGDVLSGVFEPPQRLNPQVPHRLVGVVNRALATATKDRFHTANEMLEALLNCDVFNSCRRMTEPGSVDCWTAETTAGAYRAQITSRSRVGEELTISKDGGHGPRIFFRKRFATEAKARQALASKLRALVEGRLS